MKEQKYYRINEVQGMFNVDRQTVRTWIQSGLLNCIRRGNFVFIDVESLETLRDNFKGLDERLHNIHSYTECIKEKEMKLVTARKIIADVIKNYNILISETGSMKNMLKIIFRSLDAQFDEREHEIVKMIFQGKSNAVIASHFNITTDRINQILQIIANKALQANTYTELQEENNVLNQRIDLLKKEVDKEHTRWQMLQAKYNELAERLKYEDINPVCMISDERLNFLSTPLSELDFSVRANGIFYNANLQTVGELYNFPRKKFGKLRNCGKKTIQEIENFFLSNHLKWN